MASRSLIVAADTPTSGVKAKLVEAAVTLVRRKGYSATSVEDICKAAGVTKGAFFHHFASKDALAVATADAWTKRAERMIFTQQPWMDVENPVKRLIAHIEFREAMLNGSPQDFTCFVGTLVQESYATSEPIRIACDASISAYAHRLAEDVQAAIESEGVADGVTALGLAFHIQAVLQGAFILAKAKGDPAIARASVTHLKCYVKMLFSKQEINGGNSPHT